MKTTEAITGFLRQQYDAHNGKDLLDFYLLHEGALETQVNVAAGNGRPVPGRTSTYSDENGNEWWNIRIPKKADSEPEWSDYHLKWPLELHTEAIGSTGWDWRAKVSRYVGFDFDAIAGHAQGVGVTDEALDRVRQAAMDLPYVTVRRSTGGAGIHLYVFFADGVPTANHTEHAALARCVLGMMSHEAGFNFAAQIDACGGNMWIYHRKSTKENRGLELIKAGDPLARVPSNWRDHLEVVSRKRAKVRLDGIDDQNSDNFDRLTSSHPVVPLDEQHHAHIAHLEKAGFCCVWVQDHNLLQTHTVGFQQIADDAQFGIKGIYKTNSNGKDPATPNCFAFPMADGAWRINRFSPGISEAETWEQDGQGWTTCYFNRPAKLKTAARALKAKELKKGFEFETLADAAKALDAVGVTIDVPDAIKDRKAAVRILPEGRLSVEVPKVKAKVGQAGDPDSIGQWSDADKKTSWSQIIDGPPVEENTVVADTLPPVCDPHYLAGRHITKWAKDGHRTSIAMEGKLKLWLNGVWRDAIDKDVADHVTATIKAEFDTRAKLTGKAPLPVTRTCVQDTIGALRSLSIVTYQVPPFWIGDSLRAVDGAYLDARDFIAFRNGLMHLSSWLESPDNFYWLPPTPRYYSEHMLAFDFWPQAPEPTRWLQFLNELWDDPTCHDLLHEWMGYCMTTYAHFQKMMMMLGKPRAGKGTIWWVMEQMVGGSVASPDFESLLQPHGLAPLLGKQLALLPDAKSLPRKILSNVCTKLKAIIGQDPVLINPKNQPQITTRLPIKLTLQSNELIAIPDFSEAMQARQLFLRFDRSFIGQEDEHLKDKLLPELSGIANLALAGLRRLMERGRFTEPAASRELAKQIRHIGNPVAGYVESRCIIDDNLATPTTTLFADWEKWADEMDAEPMTPRKFGEHLLATVQSVRKTQNIGGRKVAGKAKRPFCFVGIGLKESA